MRTGAAVAAGRAGQPAGPAGHQRPGAVPGTRQTARHPQYTGGDHQLERLFHRCGRNHPLHPAKRVQCRTQSRHRPRPVAHPRRAAVQRTGIPHQPERHRVRCRGADQYRRASRQYAQPVQPGFQCRAPALYRHQWHGQHRQCRRHQHHARRPGLPDCAQHHQQRADQRAERPDHSGCRAQRRTARPGVAQSQCGNQRPRHPGAQPRPADRDQRAHRHLRAADRPARQHQRRQRDPDRQRAHCAACQRRHPPARRQPGERQRCKRQPAGRWRNSDRCRRQA